MATDAHLICYCALSCLLLVSVKCEITKKPKNTLALFGETSVLQCCSDVKNSKLQWKRYVDGLPQKIALCPNEACQDSGYLIDEKDPGCSNVIVVHASANQAGLYHCEEDDTKATKHKVGAYLIVFSLNCSANSTNEQNLIEGADVLFRCTTEWTGGTHLAMSWASENGIILNRTEFTKPQDTYSSSLRVTLRRPELHRYSVSVQFLSTAITDPNVDKSTPMVNWSSTKRNVAYPVTDLQTGCKNDYCERPIDGTVFCGALGYPRPDIRWFDENGEFVGERLKITFSGEQRFSCVATNTVGDKTYTVFRNVTVLGKQSENTEPLHQIQGTLVYIAAILSIGLGVLIYFIGRKVYSWFKGRRNKFPCASREPAQQPSQVSNDPDEQGDAIPLRIRTQSSHENGDNYADVGHSNQNSKLLLRNKESIDGNTCESTNRIAQPADESENESAII